jgi:prolyl-tRNA synthetase
VSTRHVGGVIMTHGDDDGLRLPPAIAPRQIVIVPMLRDKPEDAEVLAYAQGLAAELNELTALKQPIRAFVDTKPLKSAEKRWNWVRKGAPVIVEIGPRDAANQQVTYLERSNLRDGDKVRMNNVDRASFVERAPSILAAIQQSLFDEAKARLDGNIVDGVTDWAGVESYFGAAASDDDEAGAAFKGWLRVGWSKPTGAALDAVVEKLKSLKLTVRNAPQAQPAGGLAPCLFTGDASVESILIARSY